ncbi:MAG TPA: twin-arginine translocase subunit TatC [Thermoplasmata archaeon]|nr:twin-arginine translocase subunit TatC [Thermoplasmata archaeon]
MADATPDTDDPSQKRMTFWEHIEELRDRLKSVLIVLMVLFVLFLTFSLGSVTIAGVQVPMIFPAFASDQSPMANQFFLMLKAYLVPPIVNGLPLHFSFKTPWDGVLVQIKAAMFLAVLVGSPVIAYELGRFIGPALKPSERRLILRVTVPVLVLFLSGIALCYVVVLPFTFRLLYSVQTTVGADFLVLFADDFISFTLLFLLAFGLAFQLPVLMYALSWLGVVGADFWKKYWRFAAVAIFAFGAIITPDGSGVTMMFVALPMLVLYVIGYAASRYAEGHRIRAKSS